MTLSPKPILPTVRAQGLIVCIRAYFVIPVTLNYKYILGSFKAGPLKFTVYILNTVMFGNNFVGLCDGIPE